jgi:hypothetical protein
LSAAVIARGARGIASSRSKARADLQALFAEHEVVQLDSPRRAGLVDAAFSAASQRQR